jgi:hypothetical protein
MNASTKDTLLRQLDMAWKLAAYHLEGLTTEECLWRPASAGPHVHRGTDGAWRADWPEHEGYGLGPPSIAWTTWHMGFWWSMAFDHAFGGATLAREPVAWPFSGRPFADAVAWANAELMKNAAEIGYARFLYAVRAVPQ